MISPSPPAGEGRLGEAERGEGSTLSERAKFMLANPTDAEQRLWSTLRDRRIAAFKFRRQFVQPPYIVDFVRFEQQLIIEAEGSQQADSSYNVPLDDFLRREGFAVLRFWNNDVMTSPQSVFQSIDAALKSPHPARAPRASTLSPKGRGVEEVYA